MWIYNDPMTNSLDELEDTDMDAAKYVRTVGKGGAALNFACMTGDSHRYLPFTLRSIHQMLARGIRCFELLDDGTEVELTELNYKLDNGGKAVPETDKPIDNDEQRTIKELRDIATANAKIRCNKANPEATIRNINELVIDVVSAKVAVNTDIDDITEIPATAQAVFDLGPNKEVELDWDTSTYDKTTAGEYTITATATNLPSNVTDNDAVTVDFKITVGTGAGFNGPIIAGGGSIEEPDDDNEF